MKLNYYNQNNLEILRMKKICSIGLMVLAVNLASCQNNTGSQSHEAASGSSVKSTLTADEFDMKLRSDTTAQLVDVRTPEEYGSGHLRNAANINIRDNSFEQQAAKLDKNKPVLVYCKAGSRSAAAADKLQEMGFKTIYNLDGGIMKWENEGKPLAGASSAGWTGMTMDAFTQLVSENNYVLVDYNAQWCVPCKQMMPVLEALAGRKKDKLKLLKIDADENKDLLKQKNISDIPYLELYNNGKLVWSHKGTIKEDELLTETGL